MVFAFTPLVCVCARIGVVYTLFLVKFTISGISFHPSMVSHQDKLETNPSYFHSSHEKCSLTIIEPHFCRALRAFFLGPFWHFEGSSKRDSHFRPAATEAWGTGFPWMVPYPALAPAWWLFFSPRLTISPHVRFRSTYIFYNTINYYVL